MLFPDCVGPIFFESNFPKGGNRPVNQFRYRSIRRICNPALYPFWSSFSKDLYEVLSVHDGRNYICPSTLAYDPVFYLLYHCHDRLSINAERVFSANVCFYFCAVSDRKDIVRQQPDRVHAYQPWRIPYGNYSINPELFQQDGSVWNRFSRFLGHGRTRMVFWVCGMNLMNMSFVCLNYPSWPGCSDNQDCLGRWGPILLLEGRHRRKK
jgi:hypothetical protein